MTWKQAQNAPNTHRCQVKGQSRDEEGIICVPEGDAASRRLGIAARVKIPAYWRKLRRKAARHPENVRRSTADGPNSSNYASQAYNACLRRAPIPSDTPGTPRRPRPPLKNTRFVTWRKSVPRKAPEAASPPVGASARAEYKFRLAGAALGALPAANRARETPWRGAWSVNCFPPPAARRNGEKPADKSDGHSRRKQKK